MANNDSREATDDGKDAVDSGRREKLQALRAAGNAYPNDFWRQNLAAELAEAHETTPRDELDIRPVLVRIAGRLVRKREAGKASFATLQDMSGTIQLYVTDSYPGKAQHRAFKQWDLGDIVGVEGVLFKTQSGEVTVRVRAMRLLVKTLRAPPAAGALPGGTHQRERYVGLLMSEDLRLTFIQRSRIVGALRNFLVARDYIEVETPIMQPRIGADRQPAFSTHHNALDIDLHLRTAADRYLQRLIVGGFEKVFELSRTFRNERSSPTHHPEFTLLEFHVAYRDPEHVMRAIETMLGEVAHGAIGSTALTRQGSAFDVSAPYERISVSDALRKHDARYDEPLLGDRGALAGHLKELGISFGPADSIEALGLALFEHTAARMLVQPTFITGYAAATSPFARRSTADQRYAERFELYIAGVKIASGWSIPNDPEEHERYGQEFGAAETRPMPADPDYLRALETGMPPASGAAIGIDRLVMVLTDAASIEDVILFPLAPRADAA